MELIDTHCHLDVGAFEADRDAVLAASRDAGLRGIVVPAIAAPGWPALRALCAAHADLHPAYGLHPVFVADHGDDDLVALEVQLAAGDAVAVGEIGLDHVVPGLDRDRQRALLDAQLAIAATAGLPVLLHVRKAHDAMLAALRRARVPGGIAHAFNGSLEQAGRYLDLGFRLGFGGMLTFERSRKLRKLARDLPPEALVLEMGMRGFGQITIEPHNIAYTVLGAGLPHQPDQILDRKRILRKLSDGDAGPDQ